MDILENIYVLLEDRKYNYIEIKKVLKFWIKMNLYNVYV